MSLIASSASRIAATSPDVQDGRGGSATKLAQHFETGDKILLGRATIAGNRRYLMTHTCLSARD